VIGRDNMHLSPSGSTPRPAMRSPGLPGTDIRRSPIMPPQPHPNTTLRLNQSNFTTNGKLHVPRGYESGQPSPVSPSASPLVNSAPTTPGTFSPPRPAVDQSVSYDDLTAPIPGLHDAMRRKVRPRDISGPTFVMSTSRVPTVGLPPEAADNRSRSNSRAAPPLPPINPRRRQDSTKARTMMDAFSRHRGDTVERDATASAPHLPLGEPSNGVERRGTVTTSDEEEPRAGPRRPQRAAPDGGGMNINFNKPRGNNPPIHVGPPASRMVVAQGRNHPANKGLPGGMI
jgi:hypothetical protein